MGAYKRASPSDIHYIKKHRHERSKELAKKLNLSELTVSRIKKSKPVDRKINNEDFDFIKKSLPKGYNYVAGVLKVNINTLKYYCKVNGLVSKKVNLIEKQSLIEEIKSLSLLPYNGTMFNSAYERIKKLNNLIENGY